MAIDRQFFEKVKRDVLYGHDIAPPYVDVDKCKGCGPCIKVCPALVFELREKKSEVVLGENCFACGHCWAVCPEEAVTQEEVTATTELMPGPEPAVTPDTLQLLIRERRSTRLFIDKLVSREQLLKIIEAGRYGPTDTNRQDVNFVVVSDKDKVSELRSLVESYMEKSFKAMQNRVISFFFAMKFGRTTVDIMRYYAMGYQSYKGDKKQYAYFPLPYGSAVIIIHAQSFDIMAQFNCAVALYNCSLMALSLGLGSCFLGFVHLGANMDKKIKGWLDIPKDHESYGAMVVGYPDVKYRRLIERKKPGIKWL